VSSRVPISRRGLWDWSMWIEPVDPRAGYTEVRAITYGLHPACPCPNRVIRNAETRFRLNLSSHTGKDQTWGRFKVSAARRVLSAHSAGGNLR
jgi:hypothetical protein